MREEDIKIDKLRLYLDNCCFNRPFDDQMQLKIRLETEAKLYIQQGIFNGKYELAWSYVLDYENGLSPFAERRNRIARWKDVAAVMCEETDSILAEAESLWKIGVKTLDSLHVACAAAAHCDYFITADRRLLKKPVVMIRMADPIEFIREWA